MPIGNPKGKKKKREAKANGKIRNTGSRAPTKKDCAEKSRNEIESTNFSSLTPIVVFIIYFFFANITKITTVKLGRTTEEDSEEKVNATHYIRRKKNNKETMRKRVDGAVVRR